MQQQDPTGGPVPSEPPAHPQYSYTIRQHVIFLIGPVLGVQLAAAVLILLFQAFMLAVAAPTVVFGWLNVAIILLIQLSAAAATVAAILAWTHTTYVVRPQELITQQGLWSIQERTHPIEYVQDVQISQGPGGRLLNFGTLQLQDDRGETLTLRSVPQPQRYADLIRQTGKAELAALTMLPRSGEGV